MRNEQAKVHRPQTNRGAPPLPPPILKPEDFIRGNCPAFQLNRIPGAFFGSVSGICLILSPECVVLVGLFIGLTAVSVLHETRKVQSFLNEWAAGGGG